MNISILNNNINLHKKIHTKMGHHKKHNTTKNSNTKNSNTKNTKYYSRNKKYSNNHHTTHKTHKTHKTHMPNYIQKLINLYYNNDNVVDTYNKLHQYKQHIFPNHRRIIVIGDIHGDLEAAITSLILGKCITAITVPINKSVSSMNRFFNNIEWCGNDTYVVQLGDQIDRVRPQEWDSNDITNDTAYEDEGSTLDIFYLFYHLNNLAMKTGGRVFSIIGNHEIMNIEGDYRYVSLQEFKSFKKHLKGTYHRNSRFPYYSHTLKQQQHKIRTSKNNSRNTRNNRNNIPISDFSDLPQGYRERVYAFSPTGLCSNYIGINNYTVLQIGNWLFCHGSPDLKTFKTYSTPMINNIVSKYLIGLISDDKDSTHIKQDYKNITSGFKDGDDEDEDEDEDEDNDKSIIQQKSILWNRTFGNASIKKNSDSKFTKELDIILKAYNDKNKDAYTDAYSDAYSDATHIAVGHTIQFTNKLGINAICNNRVWRCDIGVSKAFGNNSDNIYRKPQVLEILNSNITNILS